MKTYCTCGRLTIWSALMESTWKTRREMYNPSAVATMHNQHWLESGSGRSLCSNSIQLEKKHDVWFRIFVVIAAAVKWDSANKMWYPNGWNGLPLLNIRLVIVSALSGFDLNAVFVSSQVLIRNSNACFGFGNHSLLHHSALVCRTGMNSEITFTESWN